MGGKCNEGLCGVLAVNANISRRTAGAQIGSTAPPLATLAPQNALVVYIISVCCVARLGTG